MIQVWLKCITISEESLYQKFVNIVSSDKGQSYTRCTFSSCFVINGSKLTLNALFYQYLSKSEH